MYQWNEIIEGVSVAMLGLGGNGEEECLTEQSIKKKVQPTVFLACFYLMYSPVCECIIFDD